MAGVARRSWRTGRLVAVVFVVLAPVLVGVGLNLRLASHLTTIHGAFDELGTRPPDAPGEAILMLGTRPGPVDEVTWLPGTQGVESLMLVDIADDRRSVTVTSLPQHVWPSPLVSQDRPALLVQTVEDRLATRVDHMMAVDWHMLIELGAANGEEQGYRYGSSRRLQLDFMGRLMEATLHTELRHEPAQLWRDLSTVARGTAVDDQWSLAELDLLVLSLRDLRSADITLRAAALPPLPVR